MEGEEKEGLWFILEAASWPTGWTVVMLTEWGRAAGKTFGFGHMDTCSASGLLGRVVPPQVTPRSRAWEEGRGQRRGRASTRRCLKLGNARQVRGRVDGCTFDIGLSAATVSFSTLRTGASGGAEAWPDPEVTLEPGLVLGTL